MTVVVTVRSQLPAVLELVTERTGVALAKVAHDIEAHAKKDAPVDTGFLRASIQTEIHGPTKATVTSYAFYSVYQEYGTYKMSAQPYMTPAVETVGPVANQAFKNLA